MGYTWFDLHRLLPTELSLLILGDAVYHEQAAGEEGQRQRRRQRSKNAYRQHFYEDAARN